MLMLPMLLGAAQSLLLRWLCMPLPEELCTMC